MIVRALRFSPDVLILDEPTSSLGQAETEHLLSLVRRLAERGIGIIYISHYLEEVLRVADRITVLKDGQHVATLPAAGATAEGLVHLMVGRDASAFFVKESVPIGEVLMRVEDYSGPGRPGAGHRSRCAGARCWASEASWVPDGPSCSSSSSASGSRAAGPSTSTAAPHDRGAPARRSPPACRW